MALFLAVRRLPGVQYGSGLGFCTCAREAAECLSADVPLTQHVCYVLAVAGNAMSALTALASHTYCVGGASATMQSPALACL